MNVQKSADAVVLMHVRKGRTLKVSNYGQIISNAENTAKLKERAQN